MGIQDSLQRGLRRLPSEREPGSGGGWEFRTRFREDCDPQQTGSRSLRLTYRGNSGLASERIATNFPCGTYSVPHNVRGNSGLASERIATVTLPRSSHGPRREWEFRTRFREDCDHRQRVGGGLRHANAVGIQDSLQRGLRPNDSHYELKHKLCGGNSGLASERIATLRWHPLHRPEWWACGNSGLASERIATSSVVNSFDSSTALWEFRTRFREDCD